MGLCGHAALLRIYMGEGDRAEGRPLFESVVLRAREQGLAGATVLRGPMGFGHASHIHTAKILRLSDDLPVLVEIVDTEDRLRGFAQDIGGMLASCLVTLERVEVLRYGGAADASDTN